MGEKITQQIELDRIAREQGIRLPMTRYTSLIRKYAKQEGLNIKGII